MAIHEKTETQVTMTVTGTDHYDLKDQVKEHFGLVEPEVQKVQVPVGTYKGYHATKIKLIKMLRQFDRDFFGHYNTETGQVDTNVQLMAVKKFVEGYMGEPDKDIQDSYYN